MTSVVFRPAAAADVDHARRWSETQFGSMVVIVAVMHVRRSPRRWRRRS